MSKPIETVEFNFVEDSPGYYLYPGQIWYSGLFAHHTMSAVEHDASGLRHIVGLDRLRKTSQEADTLLSDGWERAVFIGKLMAFEPDNIEGWIEKRRKSSLPPKSPEEIDAIAKKHAGLKTGLFALRPVEGGESPGNGERSPQLVAATSSDGDRSLRILPDDIEEHRYDDQFGVRQAPTDLDSSSWEALEAFHNLLRGQLSAEMSDRGLHE